MSVVNFNTARDEAEKYDKTLHKNLIEMQSDMQMALDLSPGECPDENPEKNALMLYERTLAASIKRLEELSPYLK